MVANIKSKLTTSTVKENPAPELQSVEMTDPPPAQQTETEAKVGIFHDEWVAEAAYYKAEERNFEPGHEQEDWLEAEQEYETLMEK